MQHLTLFSRRNYRVSVRVSHIISKIVELALVVMINNLLGGKHSLGLRVPVHHPQSSVYEPLVIEVNEHLQHTLAAYVVHGECRTVPVAGSTQPPQLLQYDASVFLLPCPGIFEELLTGQVTFLYPLLGQTVHHLGLRGYGSMVGARHPQCILPLESGFPHEYVLNSVVQHVPHVQHSRHVWWGNHYGVGLPAVGFAGEQTVLVPVLIPLPLYLLWAVCRC